MGRGAHDRSRRRAARGERACKGTAAERGAHPLRTRRPRTGTRLARGRDHAARERQPASRAGYAGAEARLLRAHRQPAQALAAAEPALATLGELSVTSAKIKTALVEATEAALALPDLDKAEQLLAIPETLDPGQLTPLLHAHSLRLRARLDAAHDNHQHVDEHFRAATALYQEFNLTFHQAVSQLEHADWLITQNRSEEAQPSLAEARQIFEQLQATPWLERTVQATTPARRQAEAAIR